MTDHDRFHGDRADGNRYDGDRFGGERADGTGTHDDASLDAQEILLAALGAGERPVGGDAAEQRLLDVLADWRASTEAAPLPALPTDREIHEALSPEVVSLHSRRGRVRAGEHHHGRRPAMWQAVTGAAAVAAVLVGGLSVAAHQSAPGDPLWGVNKTIFADHAGEVELVSELTDSLQRAGDAARNGDRDTAARLLEEVSARLGQVGDPGQRVELMRLRDAIERDLSRVTPTAVPSPAPAPAPEAGRPPQSIVPVTPTSPVEPPVSPTAPPVVPVPPDALRTSSSPVPPVDPQRLQDLLSPSTVQPGPDVRQLAPEGGAGGASPTAVPTSAAQDGPRSPASVEPHSGGTGRN